MGAQEIAPDIINPNYPTWQEGASKVMYCFATCMQDYMLRYIRDGSAKIIVRKLEGDFHGNNYSLKTSTLEGVEYYSIEGYAPDKLYPSR